jgi:hypothetical protein
MGTVNVKGLPQLVTHKQSAVDLEAGNVQTPLQPQPPLIYETLTLQTG